MPYPQDHLPWPYSDHLPQLSPDGKILTFNMMTQMRHNMSASGSSYYNNGYGMGYNPSVPHSANESDEAYKQRVQAQASELADLLFSMPNLETICLQEAPKDLTAFEEAFKKQLDTYALPLTQAENAPKRQLIAQLRDHLSRNLQTSNGTIILSAKAATTPSVPSTKEELLKDISSFLNEEKAQLKEGGPKLTDIEGQLGAIKKEKGNPLYFSFFEKDDGTVIINLHGNYIKSQWPFVQALTSYFLNKKNLFPIFTGDFNRAPGQDPIPDGFILTNAGPGSFSHPARKYGTNKGERLITDESLDHFIVPNIPNKTPRAYLTESATFQIPTIHITTQNHAAISPYLESKSHEKFKLPDNQLPTPTSKTVPQTFTINTGIYPHYSIPEDMLEKKLSEIRNEIQNQILKLQTKHQSEADALQELLTKIDMYKNVDNTDHQNKLAKLQEIADEAINIQKRNDLCIAQSRGKGQLKRGFINVALMVTLIGLVGLLIATYLNKPGLRKYNIFQRMGLLASGNATFWQTSTESALNKAAKVAETIKKENKK